LEQKCKHFEKQKRQMQLEEEELHEQIGHSQEIIEKLTDVESELKERLQAEIVDKEYLQECLDETGNILYLLRNNESKLKQDRDLLLDDLEQELEVMYKNFSPVCNLSGKMCFLDINFSGLIYNFYTHNITVCCLKSNFR